MHTKNEQAVYDEIFARSVRKGNTVRLARTEAWAAISRMRSKPCPNGCGNMLEYVDDDTCGPCTDARRLEQEGR